MAVGSSHRNVGFSAPPSPLQHGYAFDPSYGYGLDRLLAVEPPPEPAGFAEFWRPRHARALAVDPAPQLRPSAFARTGFRVWDLEYRSTDEFPIGGWLLEPEAGSPQRGLVAGHGYADIGPPNGPLPCDDAVYLFPCFRGLGRSRRPPISENPAWHVLHHIEDPARYILGGCVDDLWTAVSALLRLRPGLADKVGYLGISFSGGIGALALPWDARIGRAHLNVPTFGHQPLRLTLPTTGSAAAVQAYAAHRGNVLETLGFYDAAVAARRITQPVHVAAALFDPAVAPPGQFAIYNALPGAKRLFVLRAGHFDYPERAAQEKELLAELGAFFDCDESRVPLLVEPAHRA